jgi:hypothetical protein
MQKGKQIACIRLIMPPCTTSSNWTIKADDFDGFVNPAKGTVRKLG